MAAVCNFLRVFNRIQRIGKQCLHLFFGFHKILTALIAHTIFIRKLFAGLQTKQNVMRLRIFFISVMHVVSSHQIDAQLLMHPQQLLIDLRLLRNAMILQLQEKISFSKTGLIF